MTKFKKENFCMGSGSDRYVTYYDPEFNAEKRFFIARFKYNSPAMSAKHFVKFLIANFTIEEYIEAEKQSSPLKVLEAKGYISYTSEQQMKKAGFPLTAEGYKAYREDYSKKFNAFFEKRAKEKAMTPEEKFPFIRPAV